MIIDFHTHAFPDALAPKALPKLADSIGYQPFTDGTVNSLLNHMDECGVDKAIICNIATNPKQQTNVNNFAISTLQEHGDRLVPLGSIHPYSENKAEEIKRLKAAGIKGLKLHPDYVGITIDSPLFDEIFDLCTENNMFIIIHAGFDVYSPDKVFANPDAILRRLEKNPDITLIGAHYGGNMLWDEVESKLCGKNMYIDVSMGVMESLSKEQAVRIIEKHGVDKVLFGSDSPWCPMSRNIEYISSLPLSDETKEKIFFKNALKLLGE